MPSSQPVASTDTKTNSNAISSAEVGMLTEIKNLYEGKPDDRGRTTWVDQYPDDLEEAVENAETARYALLVRHTKSYDGRRSLQIHSVVVQSPLLKDALSVVLNNYPGITTSLDRLTFNAPFKPLVHRWTNLVEALEQETETDAKSHLNIFYQMMQKELQDDLKAWADYVSHKVITFETCWMLFAPGTIVYAEEGKDQRAFRLERGSYGGGQGDSYFALTCEYVDWDGEEFGIGTTRKFIYSFQGTKAITALEAFPLKYHEREMEIKESLVERGAKFESISGYHYKHYNGIATGQGAWGPIETRIIIDTYAWNRFNPDHQVTLDDLPPHGDSDCSDDSPDTDEPDDANQKSEKSSSALTADELLLCSPTVKGYSLKTKKWLTFRISSVGEIKWNERAFESLVLPGDHKELILALTESQVANKATFDDVIQGKGDLGLDSSDVESSLSNVLEMCTKWNAILLLDEADVFLEQRSAHDLERNKLVSRILFLTTNRVDNIDAAFESRIHISMEYNELSVSARRQIWSSFASAGGAKQHGFSSTDIDKLAEYSMNGREIKNVLKTAQLLAGRKKQALGTEHVETVLAIEKRNINNRRVGKEEAGNGL
ncbi:MAG: hypothetical protein Q9222_003396 [Ikaeria aurantiellina]